MPRLLTRLWKEERLEWERRQRKLKTVKLVIESQRCARCSGHCRPEQPPKTPYLFSVTSQHNRGSLWWGQTLTACQPRFQNQIKPARDQSNIAMISNILRLVWCHKLDNISHISQSDDSRERAAYVHLNKSQLNQYCTALAIENSWHLYLFRRGGGNGAHSPKKNWWDGCICDFTCACLQV